MLYTNSVIAWCFSFRVCDEWINSRFKNNDRQGKSGSSGNDLFTLIVLAVWYGICSKVFVVQFTPADLRG